MPLVRDLFPLAFDKHAALQDVRMATMRYHDARVEVGTACRKRHDRRGSMSRLEAASANFLRNTTIIAR
ncbi:hypothetical protein DF051_37120 [Burkholderia contaminans]|uniref:Uncharacterized protein n=1 Tax=Burkholderia contaminans TaxID=488447 RepID=A0A3N8PBK6_9BURK|nr:hypothetical protein DF051_37120 [Burkholderia contaminans]